MKLPWAVLLVFFLVSLDAFAVGMFLPVAKQKGVTMEVEDYEALLRADARRNRNRMAYGAVLFLILGAVLNFIWDGLDQWSWFNFFESRGL